MAIRAVIADDEAEMRFIMKKALEKLGGVTVIGEAGNGLEAVALVERLKPDCIFLDVEMPEVDGVAAARGIKEIAAKTKIVFVTAHQEYMPQAFETYAYDYMVKPFRLERLKETVEKIRAELDREPEKVMLKLKDGLTLIAAEDIVIIQREERQTAIITLKGKYHVAESLSDLMETLPQGDFIRSHKSYIVNLRHIKKISSYGRWTFICEFNGVAEDALITSKIVKELEGRIRGLSERKI